MTQPADLLMEFALSLLVPFLTTGSLTDPALARRAAAETIAAYKAAGQDQLVTIAQLVAFALASLDNLRLSMPPDLSLSMKLKLRGTANALNRASQHATATLDRQRRDITSPERDETEILASLEAAKIVVQQALAAHPPAPIATPNHPPATPALANPIRIPDAAETQRKKIHALATDRHIDCAWASAMTDVGAEYTAELPHLTPAQRQTHLARIGALSEISTMLGRGEAPPLKARLLGSTTLRG
jgi:hypothetical protein